MQSTRPRLTALHAAALVGETTVNSSSKGAQLNVKDNKGRTRLAVAGESGVF